MISILTMLLMTCPANAATIGYIDVEKVFSNYEKTKKTQEDVRRKGQIIQDEIINKQKELEKEKSKGMPEAGLRNLVDKFEKEIGPKKTAIEEYQKKMKQEIYNDIKKATETTAKKMGLEIVLDKTALITGGTDITDEVISLLNKK